MSNLTTHILDTAKGCPACCVEVELFEQSKDLTWSHLAKGITNDDGRIPGFLPEGKVLARGQYKIIFFVEGYFNLCKVQGFYPKVEIEFFIRDDSHYHIPLLLSPYGYSTYRGS